MSTPHTRPVNPALLQQNLNPEISANCLGQEEVSTMTISAEPLWVTATSGVSPLLAQPLVIADLRHSTKPSSCPKLPRNKLLTNAQALIAAVYVDLIGFSGNQDQTRAIEPIQFNARIQSYRRTTIAVSKKLRVSRQDAMTKSLFVPSGAYLSWLAMNGDDGIE